MLAAGKKINKIAAYFNVHRHTIGRVASRHRTTASVKDRVRSGRPRVTTPAQDRYILNTHLRNRFLPANDTARNIPGLRVISSQTVRNRLHQFGLWARRAAIRLVLSPHNRHVRLLWAREHVRWTRHQWNGVLFTDESRFCLQGSDGRKQVYRRKGERYANNCIQERDRNRGGSIMVWGGISFTGRTELVLVNGNMNALYYRDVIVEQHIFPFIAAQRRRVILQQDNARPHIARIVRDRLQAKNIDLLQWSAVSPDFSPIEHVWDQLEIKIRQRPNQPQTLNELFNALREEWNNMDQFRMQRLINSMRRRCQAAINSFGGHTRY